jgi:TP901-1 family phage major tail protein
MAAQKAKDLLLKLDSTGAGVFVTVAGLRTRTFSLAADTVDITHAESPGRWRELLEGAGQRSARLAGSGLFKDGQADALVRQYIFDGTIRNWQIVVPDFGTLTGPFQVTSLEYGGRHDGEVTFELALESAGALTFAAI